MSETKAEHVCRACGCPLDFPYAPKGQGLDLCSHPDVERLVEAALENEWCNYDIMLSRNCCPECLQKEPHHLPDCRWASVLDPYRDRTVRTRYVYEGKGQPLPYDRDAALIDKARKDAGK